MSLLLMHFLTQKKQMFLNSHIFVAMANAMSNVFPCSEGGLFGFVLTDSSSWVAAHLDLAHKRKHTVKAHAKNLGMCMESWTKDMLHKLANAWGA